ncbi:hypothetical protein AB0G49_00005, partial [Streptomyces longwoodensis]
MVTFAQAQERAEEWINGDVPAYQHREVRVREFELGFVVWGEDRADGPRSDAGGQRLVIARDSGEATLWPALPVGEVIRRYEEEYGRPEDAPQPAPAAARVDLNQTSFLLSPPEWLQEAADKLGIPDRREPAGSAASAASSGSDGAGTRAGGAVTPDPSLARTQAGVPGEAGAAAGAPAAPASGAPATPASGAPAAPVGATPWAGTDTNADAGDDRSVPLPATVFAPPLSGSDDEPRPPVAPPEAKTALISGGSQLPPTAFAPALDDAQAQGTPPTPPAPPSGPSYGYPQGPGAGTGPAGAPQDGPGTSGRPLAPHAGDIADAATSKAAPPPRRGGGATPPPPPGA